jgi:putative transposase
VIPSQRRQLQAAYERPTYAEATATLLRLRRELTLVNESAVRSLDEGLEEALTLHRLDLVGPLGISLKTTNCLESRNAQLGAYCHGRSVAQLRPEAALGGQCVADH